MVTNMTQEKNCQEINLPNYREFQEALLAMETELSPAECQGIALGLLAWDNQSRAAAEWTRLLHQECDLGQAPAELGSDLQESASSEASSSEPLDECHQWLNDLFASAFKGLKDNHFGLSLYLPSDDTPLYLRAAAASQWCRGFMFGLGLMGFDNRMLSNMLINEALQDISQIMNIEVNPEEMSESSEKEYFELVEYLRMATLLIYSEITGIDQGAGKSAHGLH